MPAWIIIDGDINAAYRPLLVLSSEEATRLRDNLVGLIEPMLSSAGANLLALCTARKKSSDDRPHALKIPAPKGRNLH